MKKQNNTNSIFCSIRYSGIYGTLGYYEDSEDDPSTFIEEFDDGTKIDLKIVVDKMIELGDKTDYAPYIEIDENTIIVLDYVDMEYIDSNNLRHCYFEGWVLVK